MHPRSISLALALFTAGCDEHARLSVDQVSGTHPQLVKPVHSLIPSVDIADAVGWPSGATPTPAPGLRVNEFAGGLAHPRSLLVLPNGDVLVAESASPGTDPGPPGIKGFFFNKILAKAGSKVPSANRITLL